MQKKINCIKGSATSFSITFCVIPYQVIKFDCLTAFTFEILGNVCIEIICFPVCDITNFEINLSKQVVFLYKQEVKTTF